MILATFDDFFRSYFGSSHRVTFAASGLFDMLQPQRVGVPQRDETPHPASEPPMLEPPQVLVPQGNETPLRESSTFMSQFGIRKPTLKEFIEPEDHADIAFGLELLLERRELLLSEAVEDQFVASLLQRLGRIALCEVQAALREHLEGLAKAPMTALDVDVAVAAAFDDCVAEACGSADIHTCYSRGTRALLERAADISAMPGSPHTDGAEVALTRVVPFPGPDATRSGPQQQSGKPNDLSKPKFVVIFFAMACTFAFAVLYSVIGFFSVWALASASSLSTGGASGLGYRIAKRPALTFVVTSASLLKCVYFTRSSTTRRLPTRSRHKLCLILCLSCVASCAVAICLIGADVDALFLLSLTMGVGWLLDCEYYWVYKLVQSVDTASSNS